MKLKEKTTATLLIAIFMISTLSVMSIGAPAVGYTEAVLNAGDRLVEMQNDDGGFMWQVLAPPTPTTSSTNIIGVTAIGILKAHELLDKPDYEAALAKTYKFVVDNVPVYVGSNEQKPYGVDSWPDITFLIELADAADEDASLLAAIEAEVSGTTVAGIAALAKARYDLRLAAKGPSATEMAEWILDIRTIYPGYGFWEVRSIVKACLSLESHYPAETYDYYGQAQEAATVIYANLDGGTYPFYIGDETQMYYVIGISGAIEAFSELGIHSTKTQEMTDLLIGFQSLNGYWDRCGVGGQESVQSTAYAVMALFAQGDNDARVSALEGANWLVDTQDGHGGWVPCYLGGTENLEVDSEAAWALSGLVKSTHEYICVWWLEDAERYGGDGTLLDSWTDDRIPPPSPVGYVEFKVTGRAYHGDMEWFYNYRPLENFEASPLVIANGKFSAWARYTSPRSGLPILDKIRGKLTISQGTAFGSYTQYGYAFGDESTVKSWYPNAVATDETDMWHIGTTDYTVHGQE